LTFVPVKNAGWLYKVIFTFRKIIKATFKKITLL
jgi:hypothetical protein